jgi:hypothetical protein
MLTEKRIEAETVEQLKSILDKLHRDGQRWIKGVSSDDWRRTRYISSRARRPRGGDVQSGPSVSNIIEESGIILNYVSQAASNFTAESHNYFIIKPDNGCLTENGLALLRPVLKKNFDDEPQLNFHIWFHCMPNANPNDHLMVGWRLESPEGSNSTHDFYHAQPLRRFGIEASSFGMPDRFSERFPTIPLPASNLVELCLNAVLVACGKDALRTFIRNSSNEKVRIAARDLWSKIFSVSAGSAAE